MLSRYHLELAEIIELNENKEIEDYNFKNINLYLKTLNYLEFEVKIDEETDVIQSYKGPLYNYMFLRVYINTEKRDSEEIRRDYYKEYGFKYLYEDTNTNKDYKYGIHIYGCDDSSYYKNFQEKDEVIALLKTLDKEDKVNTKILTEKFKMIFTN